MLDINPKWKHSIEIKVGDRPENEVVAELAGRLRALPASFRASEHGFTSLNDIIGWLDEIKEHGQPITHESVDDILRELYDWADENRLWVFLG